MLIDDSFKQNYYKSNYKDLLTQNLRKYCEFTSEGKDIKRKIERLKENCRISINAFKLIEEANTKDWDILKKNIFQEHIFPIAECRRQLYSLIDKNPTIDEVGEILQKLEIVIISREEMEKMNINYKSKGEPKERLKEAGVIIHKNFIKNKLN